MSCLTGHEEAIGIIKNETGKHYDPLIAEVFVEENASALMLGVGMCFAMIWGNMIIGIPIGVAGIVMLLSLIPMIKGFTKPNTEMQA